MKRILVVDDETQTLRLLEKYLSARSYEVHTAVSGWEALQKTEEIKPDAVLLDIIMPGMNGIDTLEAIKKIDAAIVVFMISAVIDEAVIAKARQSGADDYLTKPIHLHQLETALLAKLSGHPGRHA